jgi:putative ABC transport system ATP-binding protein
LFREKLATLDLGLEDRMTTKVGLLSGGQRQAVTLLMASLKKPELLLLDEHTAALDPKTAAKVLEISDQIINEYHLTAMMVTHNMKDAIVHGNRLIMMNEGRIIYDVRGEEKKNLHVKDLLAKFEEISGSEFANDRMMLS